MRVTQKACGIYEEYAKVRLPLGEISPGLSRDDVVCVCSERPFSVLDVNLVTEKGNMEAACHTIGASGRLPELGFKVRNRHSFSRPFPGLDYFLSALLHQNHHRRL